MNQIRSGNLFCHLYLESTSKPQLCDLDGLKPKLEPSKSQPKIIIGDDGLHPTFGKAIDFTCHRRHSLSRAMLHYILIHYTMRIQLFSLTTSNFFAF